MAHRILLAALSLGAAAIHLAAAPAHLDELSSLGTGFPLAASLQGMWAGAWLLRPGATTAWAGIALQAAITAAWALSRTIGLPAGDAPWHAEAIALPDLAATLFEATMVASLVAYVTGATRHVPARARVVTMAILPALGLVVVTTILALNLVAADNGDAGDASGAAEEHHATP